MEALAKQLAALDADQVRRLLSASGHDALVATKGDQPAEAVDVAALKAEGNALFKQGAFEEAAQVYSQCIEANSRVDGGGGEVDAALFSNRAMAYLKLRQFDKVVDDCTSALAIASSIKPYLRRATAHIGLGDAASAVPDLDAALSFEPGNREAIRLLEQIAHNESHSRSSRIRAALLVAFRDGWRSMAVKGNPAPPGLNGHTLFTLSCDKQQRVYLFGGRAVRDQKSSVYVMDERDYSWDLVSTEGALPTPRAWHSVSAIGADTLAVYGGVSASAEDPCVHLLEVSPSATGYKLTWRADAGGAPVQPTMLARSGHATITINGKDGSQSVVVFGGRTKRGVTDELWIFTMEDSVVKMDRIARSPDSLESAWPAMRDGHSMGKWVDDHGREYAVVFGGNGQRSEEKMNDVWLLEVMNHEWTQLDCSGDMPEPRSYHSAHIVDGFMIVIGGRMVDAEDGHVYVLDIAAKEWFHIPMPQDKSLKPRAWHASIVRSVHDEIYLLGGGTFHGPSREAAVLSLKKWRDLIQHLTS